MAHNAKSLFKTFATTLVALAVVGGVVGAVLNWVSKKD